MTHKSNYIHAESILGTIQWSATIGVELEFALPKADGAVPVWYGGHDLMSVINNLEEKWTPHTEALIVPDNYCAAELASPVYDGKSPPQILAIAALLQERGAIITAGAGLHVHAGVDDVPYQKWTDVQRQMFANYVLVEPALLFPFERTHDEHASRRSLRSGFNTDAYSEYLECAENILNGPIGHMNYLSQHTQAIFGLRHDKPYNTMEWKAPKATLCPVQIASNMKFWHDLYAFSAKKALSSLPGSLPQGDEFSALMHIARTYNNNMEMSESFDIDDRVRLLTCDVETLETYNRI